MWAINLLREELYDSFNEPQLSYDEHEVNLVDSHVGFLLRGGNSFDV